tara:strand:- start:8063 stop:8464 length:402 start_codon:yes stop_codon:yes gene_type:complete
MATATLTLPNPINVSLQAKPTNVANNTTNIDNGAWDIIYFVRIDPITQKQTGDIYRFGKCISLSKGAKHYTIVVDIDAEAQTPNGGDYVFFGKENKINISGVRGYYAEVEMKNDSTSRAELFSVGCEMSPSSK